jgi:hypothetical protein
VNEWWVLGLIVLQENVVQEKIKLDVGEMLAKNVLMHPKKSRKM